MPFLPRRSVDPLIPGPPLRGKSHPQKPPSLPQTLRSRARSEASLFKRVSTLFAVRRRTSSKMFSQPNTSPRGIEYRCSHPWPALPRVSSDSTPQSSLEIRRPSGLGRRASLLESDESVSASESFERVSLEDADAALTGTVSLPNLISGTFHSPDIVTSPLPEPPRPRRTTPFPLSDSILRVVLDFLPQNDLAVVAVVSRRFCYPARYALYHSLDVKSITEPSLRRLYYVLAHQTELAALVVSFYCHSWPSSEPTLPGGLLPSIPLDDVRHALQNMYNLKSLTLASFASILSHTPSLTFSLIHLTVLDQTITQSQLVAMRSWLATQPSLESLTFPNLVECTNTDPLQTDYYGPLSAILPSLKSLRATTEIVSALCTAMHSSIEHLTLDVHETLYMGLRPSTVIRSLGGVRDMHVIFSREVDKRTVEKFLGVTGSMLTGEDKAQAMKSLEVEVSWTDGDAAETLYGIVTSIISRFHGLETLKLTSPFRSIQAPLPGTTSLTLLRSSNPPSPPRTSPSIPSSEYTATMCGGSARREFVACSIEKDYARMWTKHCPSLSDIQFDFSCSTEDVDVELCGVWFRRRQP